MSHQPTTEHPRPGWRPPYPPGQHAGLRRRWRRWVIPAVAIVVVLVSGVLTVVITTGNSPSGGPGAAHSPVSTSALGGQAGRDGAVPQIPVEIPGWRDGQPITDEILRTATPDDLFWTVYKRLAMVPVHELVQEVWIAGAGKPVASQNLVTPEIRTRRIIFDYNSKAIARAETSRSLTGDLSGAMICVDGKRYFKTETDMKEKRPYTESTAGGQDCPPALTDTILKRYPNLGLRVNDAMVTGGLSSLQADRFIDCLRERQLVSVSSVAVVQASGKSFVAVEGQLNRVEDRMSNTNTKLGHSLVRDCFDLGTELKQELHPYPFNVGGAQGLQWTYYLDPTTLRPVVSRQETTPVLGLDGSISPADTEYNASVSWVKWAYPSAVPAFTLTDGEQPLRVPWPSELPGR